MRDFICKIQFQKCAKSLRQSGSKPRSLNTKLKLGQQRHAIKLPPRSEFDS